MTDANLDAIQRAHENYFFMRRALRHGNAVDPWTIPTSSTDERINKVIDFLGQCKRFVVLKAGDADFVENALVQLKATCHIVHHERRAVCQKKVEDPREWIARDFEIVMVGDWDKVEFVQDRAQ